MLATNLPFMEYYFRKSDGNESIETNEDCSAVSKKDENEDTTKMSNLLEENESLKQDLDCAKYDIPL